MIPEFLQDKNVQRLLIVIAICVIFVWKFPKSEGFASEERDSNRLEIHVNDIPIQPAQVLPNINTVMSGSGFIPQKEIIPAWGQDTATYGENDFLDDGSGGVPTLSTSLCSPACCSEQWPTPHKLPYDRFVCRNKDAYVPTNYFCSNQWQQSGCLCQTKASANFLYDRGNNA
jgi:hypothetical protein